MAKKNEFAEMSNETLSEKLVELRAGLAKERSQIASGARAEKPARIRDLRRTIARVLTAMNAKGKGAEKNKAKKPGVQ